jgi:hypothetical protein
MGLGSEIRDPEKKPIPDPGSGSRGQKGTGSRIRIRNAGKNNIKWAVIPKFSFSLNPQLNSAIHVPSVKMFSLN